MRNVALNSDPKGMNLLDMDGLHTDDPGSGPQKSGPIRKTPTSPHYEETVGEPMRPGRGVSRAAGLRPQGPADQQVLSGEPPRVFPVLYKNRRAVRQGMKQQGCRALQAPSSLTICPASGRS